MKLRKLWKYIDTDTKVKIILPNGDAMYLRSGIMLGVLDNGILALDVGKIKTDNHEEELQIELKEAEE